jgi:gas vesicle protein
MKMEKALLGALVGMAAGITLGLLFAPDKGTETRKKILKKGGNLANSVNDKIDEKFDELLSAIGGKTKKSTVQGDYKSNT